MTADSDLPVFEEGSELRSNDGGATSKEVIAALQKCIRAMEPLDHDGRERVHIALSCAFGLDQ